MIKFKIKKIPTLRVVVVQGPPGTGGPGGPVIWGGITGALDDQGDLVAFVDNAVDTLKTLANSWTLKNSFVQGINIGSLGPLIKNTSQRFDFRNNADTAAADILAGGGTFARVVTGPSTASKSALNVQSGLTVTSPNEGDIWGTGSGLLYRATASKTQMFADVFDSLAQFATTPTTSAQLRGILADPVGTGSAYFIGGALGTPASVTLTNASGMPLAGITGFGTGIAAALAIAIGSAGAPVLFNGAGGTPTSITLTNGSGLPISTGVSGLAANVATFLASPSSANLRAALTDEVGTGAAYFVGGPLGTPSSGTLSSCTGLPVSTGIAGLASGIATFLATPTSANFRTALTDPDGTGLVVFDTSPTLTGQVLVTASGATNVPLVSRGVASHTGNLQEWQNSTPANVAIVSSTGNILRLKTASDTTTTPALMGFSGASGQCRHQYDDIYSGIQAGAGYGFHAWAYNEFRFDAMRVSGSAPSFVTDPSIHFLINCNSASSNPKGLVVRNLGATTGNLFELQNLSSVMLANFNSSGVLTSPFRSQAADPTTSEITSGLSRLVKNTTANEIRWWVNDGGTLKKSAAFT